MTESTDPNVLSPEAAAVLLAKAPWRRLVTLGDSVAEGIREPVPGYRDLSWADRVAEALALVDPGLTAFNLGRRDLLAAEIRAGQLGPALTLRPDLAIVVAGGNDLFRPDFDPDRIGRELTAMISALRAAGADVHTIGLFDLTRTGLVPDRHRRVFGDRTRELSALTAEISARYGGVHHDFGDHPLGGDPALWSSDRIHLNARGQAVAAAESIRALAAFLGRAPAGPGGADHLASA